MSGRDARKVSPGSGPRLLLTLGLALAGALAFAFLGAPAAWLLGAMVATLAASLVGAPLSFPSWLQIGVVFAVGFAVGGTLESGDIAHFANWLPSLAGLVACLILTSLASALFLRLLAGYSGATSVLASFPGHLAQVLRAASEVDSRADAGKVAMIHSLRVVALVSVLPTFLFALSESPPMRQSAVSADWHQLVVAALAALAGMLIARAIHLPGWPLIGSMLGAIGAALAGFPVGDLPRAVDQIMLVLIGAMIGTRFVGVSAARVVALLPVSLVAVVIILLLTAVVAWPLSGLTGIAFGQLLLAYAPGAADVMALIAVSLDYDAAFVGGHHVFRLLLVAAAFPLIGWFGGR